MLTWILILCLSTVPVRSQYHSESLPHDPREAKVTNLHFFVHETVGGENITAVLIAQTNITINDANNSSVPFGSLFAIDDTLRIGPEPDSEVIGNVQGLGEVLGGEITSNLVMYYDFGFSTGEFNGSSVSIFSRNPVTEQVRELSVVGGRGKFRMAKGFAYIRNTFQNETNIIAELNVTVIHYSDDI